MRILLSNKFFYPRGGDCNHTIQLKQLLENHGHQVAVFSMQHPENFANEYSEYWPSEISFNSKSPRKIIRALRQPFGINEVKNKFEALIDSFNPEIVHLHNIHSQLSPIIAKKAKENSIPLVWTLHDYKLLCPSYSMLRDGKPCDLCLSNQFSVVRNKCIKNNIPASIIGYLEKKKWDKDKLQNYTSCFIAPSIFLKNKMVEGGFQESKINQLYNFFPGEKISPVSEKETEDFFLYIGRLSKEKGVDLLLQCMEKFPSKKLKIVGDGPLRTSFENTYKNCANIEFLGFQPWEVIQKLLKATKCLVVPSEWYENNPLTIIESLVMGTPVLGADIGGIPELIMQGHNGFLFEPGLRDDLVSGLNNMIQYSFDRVQISSEASIKFSSENYYKKIIAIYEKLVG